jgi:alpha-glucosidase
MPGLGLGRDPERTPMQWSAGPRAGFSTAEPWLPVAEDFAAVNVEAQRDEPGSMLALYRSLIALRSAEPALAIGAYAPVVAQDQLLAYRRHYQKQEFLIALNLGSAPVQLKLPDGRRFAPALTTAPAGAPRLQAGVLELRGDEGVILRAL